MSPKRGVNTAREAACVKTVPSAMAEGLTGGRSDGWLDHGTGMNSLLLSAR